MWQLNGQILQQPQTLRDFPIQYQADEFENVGGDPVDHQHGALHERQLTRIEGLKVFQTLLHVPKLVQRRQKGKGRSCEVWRTKGRKEDTNPRQIRVEYSLTSESSLV